MKISCLTLVTTWHGFSMKFPRFSREIVKLRSSVVTRGNSMKKFLLVLERVSDQISPAVNGISMKKPSPKVYSKRMM